MTVARSAIVRPPPSIRTGGPKLSDVERFALIDATSNDGFVAGGVGLRAIWATTEEESVHEAAHIKIRNLLSKLRSPVGFPRL
jgi:hypothetical protein